jgi:hypothetical protein
VHRVYPSYRKNSASARRFQIHRVNTGDSEEVVKPFMRVINHMTRNFATLGPLWLQPPFTATSNLELSLFFFMVQHRAGFRPYTSSCDFAESCVFIKQSPPPILNYLVFYTRPPVSRSYGVNLPSSFNIFRSLVLVLLYQSTCVGFSTVLSSLDFSRNITNYSIPCGHTHSFAYSTFCFTPISRNQLMLFSLNSVRGILAFTHQSNFSISI